MGTQNVPLTIRSVQINCYKIPSNCQNEQGNASSRTYQLLIGQPFANCEPGNNETARMRLGGTFTLSQSFSLEQTVGISLGVFGVSFTSAFTGTWVKTQDITRTQEFEINIPPRQVVCPSTAS